MVASISVLSQNQPHIRTQRGQIVLKLNFRENRRQKIFFVIFVAEKNPKIEKIFFVSDFRENLVLAQFDHAESEYEVGFAIEPKLKPPYGIKLPTSDFRSTFV
jgi:hypothetical protein